MAKTPVLVQDIDQSAGNLATKTSSMDQADAPLISVPYTAITNRAPIRDLSKIPAPLMGVERIMFLDVTRVEGERSGIKDVHRISDPLDRVRLIGTWTGSVNNNGVFWSAALDEVLEVTFYGTGLNILVTDYDGTRDSRPTIDGGSELGNINTAGMSNILGQREYESNIVVEVTSGLSLGMHTVSLRSAIAGGMRMVGLEIVNDSTTISAPTGSAVLTGDDRHLMPATSMGFALAADFDAASDDPTTDGKGGAVVVYSERQADDSIEVKQRLNTTDTTQLNLTSTDHSNEEVVQRFNWRRFGAGRADDFTTMPTSGSSDAAFTLDDGTTTLVGSQLRHRIDKAGQLCTDQDNATIVITFVGTGLDLVQQDDAVGGADEYQVSVDGIDVGDLDTTGSILARITPIVSGLPFGTHTVEIKRISASTWNFGVQDFIVYAPKKPDIPAGTGLLGSYYLMADFVENTTQSMNTVSTGVMRKHCTREFEYVGGNFTAGTTIGSGIGGWNIWTSATEDIEYSFFGTGFDFRWVPHPARSTDVEVTIDGTNLTSANFPTSTISVYGTGVQYDTQSGSDITATGNLLDQEGTAALEDAGLIVSGLPLGWHTVKFHAASATQLIISALDIITPVYSYESSGELLHDRLVGSNAIKAETGLSDFTKGKQYFPDGVDLGASKVKWKKKELLTSTTTGSGAGDDQVIPELTYALTIGKTYRITLVAQFVTTQFGGADRFVACVVRDGGTDIFELNFENLNNTTGTQYRRTSASVVHTMAGSSLTFNVLSHEPNQYMVANGDSYVIVEELPNHIETDEW